VDQKVTVLSELVNTRSQVDSWFLLLTARLMHSTIQTADCK